MRVESKRRGEVIEILVAADGRHARGDALQRLWSPFEAGDRPGGISAGAVARILREHEGTLRVSATRDWPLVYSLTLPIQANRERRRGLSDRRREPRVA